MQVLSEFFGGHIISWSLQAPQSLNLSPPDVCLWGFMKENIKKQTTNIQRIENTELGISNITNETLHTGLHHIWGKIWMHTSLNVMNVSNA
jgi:hypothetical protein